MPLRKKKSNTTDNNKPKNPTKGNVYIEERFSSSSAIGVMELQLPRAHVSRRRSSGSGQMIRQAQRSSKSFKASSREVHLKALSDLQTAASRLPHPEVVYGAMIPEPDYSDDETEIKSTNMVARNNKVNSTNSSDKEQQKPPPQTNSNGGRLDDKGLIMPKKLVNPCLESSEKKSLHRELMFNQKMGVKVLNQKTELQKAMEKHNDKKVLKEQEKEKKSQLTPFQKALDERAQRIEQSEKSDSKEAEKVPSNEFEKIHAKLRAKMEVQ